MTLFGSEGPHGVPDTQTTGFSSSEAGSTSVYARSGFGHAVKLTTRKRVPLYRRAKHNPQVVARDLGDAHLDRAREWLLRAAVVARVRFVRVHTYMRAYFVRMPRRVQGGVEIHVHERDIDRAAPLCV